MARMTGDGEERVKVEFGLVKQAEYAEQARRKDEKTKDPFSGDS